MDTEPSTDCHPNNWCPYHRLRARRGNSISPSLAPPQKILGRRAMSERLSTLPQMNGFTGELVEPLTSKAVFQSSLAHRYARRARTKKILRSLSDEQLRDDAPLPGGTVR